MHFVYIFLLLLVSTTCLADTLEGKVVRVVDRDALVVLVSGNTQHSVRLAGIDTPERGAAFWQESQKESSPYSRWSACSC